MNTLERLEMTEVNRLTSGTYDFKVGNTIRVHVRIVEGDKERLQVYEGVVIRKQGARNRKTFTVRKSSGGVGVERIFPLLSPFIARIEVVRSTTVRRAKIYDLRQRTGRAARIENRGRTMRSTRVHASPPEILMPEKKAGEAGDTAAGDTT